MDADKNGEVDREEVRKVMQIYISEIVGEKVDSNSMPVERSLESLWKDMTQTQMEKSPSRSGETACWKMLKKSLMKIL